MRLTTFSRLAILYSFVYGKDAEITNWVESQLRGTVSLRSGVAIGLQKDGELIAGCVYDNFRTHDIEMTFAASTPKWATPSNIGVFFVYPFVQLKLARVTAIAAKANKRARKMLERLGFQLEGVARRGMDGKKDACIYGMLASECKWLRYIDG